MNDRTTGIVRGALVAATACALPLLPTPAGAGAPLPAELVTVRSNGSQVPLGGFVGSTTQAVSRDGNLVVFVSRARSLVPGDTNRRLDVFVRNRALGTTRRVSVDSDGAEGVFDSTQPVISADGRFVAFTSKSSFDGDSRTHPDVFVHDRRTGKTELVSVNRAGIAGSAVSSEPAISADGRYVAFSTGADNMVTGGGECSIVVRDRNARSSSCVTRLANAGKPSISGDGATVVYQAQDADGQYQIFAYDTASGASRIVSVLPSGATGNGRSQNPAISLNGRFVTFNTEASNLAYVCGGSGPYGGHIIIADLLVGGLDVADRTSAGGCSAGSAQFGRAAGLSADGRYVLFSSSDLALSADEPDPGPGGFVRDRERSVTVRFTQNSDGATPNGITVAAAIAPGGSVVSFGSSATDIVPEDANGAAEDGFVRTNPLLT